MVYVTVSLLAIRESLSESFQLDGYKTIEAFHAAIRTRFNILVEKGKM
jgi:hypothetical protein